MQDVGGRHLVHDFVAAFARGVRVDQRARHGGGRQALVPATRWAASTRAAKLRAKARADCADGPSVPSMLSGRPITSPPTLVFGDERFDLDRISAELAALQGLHRRRDGQQRVGKRQPDRLLAKIEAEQARAGREASLQVQRCRSCDKLTRCPISMRLPAGSRMKKRTGLRPCFLPRSQCRATCTALWPRPDRATRKQMCRLLFGLAFRIDADMHLQRCRSGTRRRRAPSVLPAFRFPAGPELAVERRHLRFQRLGRGDLDVVDADNAQRQ